MITVEQIRAARALLNWSQHTLATKAGLSLSTIKAIEAGRDVRVSALSAVEKVLIDKGVLLLEPGDTRNGGRGIRWREPSQ